MRYVVNFTSRRPACRLALFALSYLTPFCAMGEKRPHAARNASHQYYTPIDARLQQNSARRAGRTACQGSPPLALQKGGNRARRRPAPGFRILESPSAKFYGKSRVQSKTPHTQFSVKFPAGVSSNGRFLLFTHLPVPQGGQGQVTTQHRSPCIIFPLPPKRRPCRQAGCKQGAF